MGDTYDENENSDNKYAKSKTNGKTLAQNYNGPYYILFYIHFDCATLRIIL